MVSPLMLVDNGFLVRGYGPGNAHLTFYDDPLAYPCSPPCAHFLDYTPDCVGVSLDISNAYPCISGTFYLGYTGCYSRGCNWAPTYYDNCPDQRGYIIPGISSGFGEFGESGHIFVRVYCYGGQYYIGAYFYKFGYYDAYNNWLVPQTYYAINGTKGDRMCGDFQFTLEKNESLKSYNEEFRENYPDTIEVFSAHGSEPTKWYETLTNESIFLSANAHCGCVDWPLSVELSISGTLVIWDSFYKEYVYIDISGTYPLERPAYPKCDQDDFWYTNDRWIAHITGLEYEYRGIIHSATLEFLLGVGTNGIYYGNLSVSGYGYSIVGPFVYNARYRSSQDEYDEYGSCLGTFTLDRYIGSEDLPDSVEITI